MRSWLPQLCQVQTQLRGLQEKEEVYTGAPEGRVGEGGGCGHHPYVSAAAASFCSSLNPIFLTASASVWGSWELGPSSTALAEQAGRASGWGRGGDIFFRNWGLRAIGDPQTSVATSSEIELRPQAL